MSLIVNVLMSPKARMRLEARMQASAESIAPQRVLRWVNEGDANADIAFVSRDVTGFSTKQMILPDTQAFYDALTSSLHLRWVYIHSAGTDRAIYQALMARGVMVTPSLGSNAKIVAQSALAGLLALARKLPYLGVAQRAHHWSPLQDEQTPKDLSSQTAVILGWGAIAQQLAEYLAMLELKVIVVRKQANVPAGRFETFGFEQLERLLPSADWFIIACPLTAETQGLMNEARLSRLPKSACLINVARGQVVDEKALVDALKSGRIGGAFLDVFEHEPLDPRSALWDIPNIILTPHSAGFSDGNEARVDELFIAALERWLADDAAAPGS